MGYFLIISQASQIWPKPRPRARPTGRPAPIPAEVSRKTARRLQAGTLVGHARSVPPRRRSKGNFQPFYLKKNGRVGRPTPRASGQDSGDARHEHADGRTVAQTVAREASSVQAEAACSVIARGGSSVARHGVNAVLGKEALLEGERAAVPKLVHVHLPGVVRDLPARVVVQFLGHLAIEFQPDL
eukprot:scaffold6856_cov124-Isochrysis_galbana.AAC.13